MKSLEIGISGVRGVVGESFTPELAVGSAQALGTYLDGGAHISVSNTESMIRVIAEAESARRARDLLDGARDRPGR